MAKEFSLEEALGAPKEKTFSFEEGIGKPLERTTAEAFIDPAAKFASGIGSLIQFPGQIYGLATGAIKDKDFGTTGLQGLGENLQEYAKKQMSAKLKAEELPVDGFEYLIKKRTDMVKLMDEHLGSFHRSFVMSWREQNLEVSHPNLSFFTPWIPPQ
jgi:hypothetical protein